MPEILRIFAIDSNGYFAGKINNGIRIGLAGCVSFDLPKGVKGYSLVASATDETIERIFDKVYESH